MTAYYNEWEPYPAQWLRNLIKAGLIAPGDVDERSIKDVKANDLKRYTQCHFFAGIGGWSYALRLAGWPDERPVWTGSCPCQPFSVAGKQKAQSDDRHLWPEWFRLIRECRPVTLFGEQVSGAIAHGWLDEVYKGLEDEGYAIGVAVLPACGVGAPHKRDRLWFVGDTGKFELGRLSSKQRQEISAPRCASEDVAHPDNTGSQGRNSAKLPECAGEQFIGPGGSYTSNTNSESQGRSSISRSECDFWEFEPAMGRVANGIPARSHKLRAYGNAIVPQVAQAFIEAFMECAP
jgi:DNA (cytosine-5)-methyltransferase 1